MRLPLSLLALIAGLTAPALAQTSTLTCTGTISLNGFDYAVTVAPEGDFSTIDFSVDGVTRVSSELTFDGRNAQGQSIWRGGVYGMADVLLVHLSTQAPQPGDRVSVGYDGQWGQGHCEAP